MPGKQLGSHTVFDNFFQVPTTCSPTKTVVNHGAVAMKKLLLIICQSALAVKDPAPYFSMQMSPV